MSTTTDTRDTNATTNNATDQTIDMSSLAGRVRAKGGGGFPEHTLQLYSQYDARVRELHENRKAARAVSVWPLISQKDLPAIRASGVPRI